MRHFLSLTMLFTALGLHAASPLSVGWGAMAGFGSSEYQLSAHPPQPSTSTNLFSIMTGSIPTSSVAGNAGGGALEAHISYRHVLDLRGEWWWALRNAKVEEDLGSGIKRSTDFVREVTEGDLVMRLGWPIKASKGDYVRPLIEGGVFGNRTLNSHREFGITGGTSTLTKAWDGVPNEDWGWLAGAGIEWATPQVSPGIELRYYEGQKDLDPKGPNELKSKSWMIILFLGF